MKNKRTKEQQQKLREKRRRLRLNKKTSQMKKKNNKKKKTYRYTTKKYPFLSKGDNVKVIHNGKYEEIKNKYPNDRIVGVYVLFHHSNDKEPSLVGDYPNVNESGSLRSFTTERFINNLKKVPYSPSDMVGMMDNLYEEDKGNFNSLEMMGLILGYLGKTQSWKMRDVYGDGDLGLILNVYKYKKGTQTRGISVLPMETWTDLSNDMMEMLLEDPTSMKGNIPWWVMSKVG